MFGDKEDDEEVDDEQKRGEFGTVGPTVPGTARRALIAPGGVLFSGILSVLHMPCLIFT